MNLMSSWQISSASLYKLPAACNREYIHCINATAMKKIIVAAIPSLILVSCGEPISKTLPSPVPRIHHTSLSSMPLFLRKQITDCRDKRNWKSQTFNLFLFYAGERWFYPKDFSGLIDGNLIRNEDFQVIAESHYGEDFEHRYENKTYQHLVYSRPINIDLCPDTFEYEQNTIESAALNASYFINKAHQKFMSANPGTLIPPVTLKIAPRIRQTVTVDNERKTLYLTDNAFYQPAFKTITFLPHSLEARMTGFYMNFWEIPVVAAHEYGHHIFNTLMGSAATSEANHIDLCFDNRISKNFRPTPIKTREVSTTTVLQAFNEGFADLVAFYTLDKSQRDLTDIKCLQVSRDISHQTFFNGTPKVFSHEALKSFFSKKNDSPNKTCSDVDYQDIHAMGAIFAHNADRLLSRFTESSEKKLQVLYDWLKLLKVEQPKLSSLSAEHYFEAVFDLFLRLSLSKFDKKFDSSNCEEVKRIYPEFSNRLIECS
jgi:hypothetical protein